MPKPTPLAATGHGRPQAADQQALTPRTPHTRSGLAEEGFTDVELDQIHHERDNEFSTFHQQQSVPLLASSLTATFPPTGYRNQGDDYDERVRKDGRSPSITIGTVMQRLPLVFGGFMAGLLLILIVLSFKRPDVLHRLAGGTVGSNETSSSDSEVADHEDPAVSVKYIYPVDEAHTISYKDYTKFPLLATQYRAECYKIKGGFMSDQVYWPTGTPAVMDVPHLDDRVDPPKGETTKICKTTITYMLDGQVGLLADLALMAQAAALAHERNRTFLIDDTYWNRGKWTDHFQDVRARQPGPEPGCKAPPPDELVACPRTARHWVVNSRTAKFHFGHGFSNQYENPYAHGLNRLKPIYKSSSHSLMNTIRPNARNTALIRIAREEIKTLSHLSRAVEGHSGHDRPMSYIGVHLRRGDRHAVSWSFHGGYVPIPNYIEAIKDTWNRLFRSASIYSSSAPPMLYVAADSITAKKELVDAVPSNTWIFSLADSDNTDLQALASKKASGYVQSEFDKLGLDERVNQTRGMIVDFAMISGLWARGKDIVPGATICTISSSVCRLSAVGLGWKRAFGTVDGTGAIDETRKGWVEIDNRDQVVPVWQAFELFN